MASCQLKDHTFRAYNSKQAHTYATERGAYPAILYKEILDFHTSSGGLLDQLLDVGCGPGNSTKDLAPHFQRATGIDGSVEMVNAARARGDATNTGLVNYQVANAEECDDVTGIMSESVDLITAGMAAHWFNMEAFWQKAAKILKHNGTVALWTVASMYCRKCLAWNPSPVPMLNSSANIDPSTPNASRVQEILFELERNVLAPYETPSNRLSRDMYDNLLLPWTVSPPVAAFNPQFFTRKEWNRDGRLEGDGVFLMSRGESTSLESLERALGTASMVTRWRKDHPELVGTDRDCVTVTISKIREALGGPEECMQSGATALLMFKKSASS